MNKLISTNLLLLCTTCAITAQIPELSPTNIRMFSDKEAQLFDQAQQLAEKTYNDIKLTPQEQNIFDNYFDEMKSSYWNCFDDGDGWFIYVKDYNASSYLKTQGNNSYKPSNIYDNDYRTAWVEGVKGYGIGEWIEYTFSVEESPETKITTIFVSNGYVKSNTAWKNNSRVKKLKVYYEGNPIAILNLEDSRSEQTFNLPNEIGTSEKNWKLRFEILDVYKGDKYDDTAISAIIFDGTGGPCCFVAGTQVTMADGTLKNIEDIKVGDKVATFDVKAKTTKASAIEQIANIEHNNLIKYTFASGTTITATDDHPFLLLGKGWASSNVEKSKNYVGFESIAKIEIGDTFITAKGSDKLVEISNVTPTQQTYTITKLSEGTTFIANGFVVGVEMVK